MSPKSWELKCLWDRLLEFQADMEKVVTFPVILEFLEQIQACKKQQQSSSACCPQEFRLSDTTNLFSEAQDKQPRWEVTVVEQRQRTNEPKRTKKISHAERMKRQNCAPGWFCNRCLRMPWRGSLSQCESFCSSCYVDQMTRVEPTTNTVEIEVHVRERQSAETGDQKKPRIPRIIHQTWFEELTDTNYPHLARLQNSWKASGWEYRFYTDESARVYIQQHFPQRFVDAYDTLLPGAFKADFFRLLALLKDGGIYADVDVQLDATSLDDFIPSHVSFFVPRDVPIDRWPNSNYCLWNGLMGAAPGHFIIAQAVQDLLNHIENRWDYYDVEHSLCSETKDCEIWKLRSIPVLILTGPCALGISVNRALQRKNKVQGFDLGWLHSSHGNGEPKADSHDYGNGLIFLTDRYDQGELRFSDVDRSILVASTNADQFASSPIKSNRTSVHYSKSETDIMGTSGTYADNLVSLEQIQVSVHHDFF
uniref:Uncharacterized protein n=1 Tax=Entomoneis paludosa TaxID=265537 RepID=A0A7S2Y6J7_9STRA